MEQVLTDEERTVTPDWQGTLVAITTPFNADFTIDHGFLASHARLLVDRGASGIVALGSLGEGATLSFDEKIAILKTCVAAVGERAAVVAGVSSLATSEAIRIAREAASAGCHGLMVLPPYAYSTDWREMKAHVGEVLDATNLPAMLYNNPIAYRTDFLPEQIAELAGEYGQLVAVKESSSDVRRITAIRHLLGARVDVLVGIDDVILEGVAAGAVGWVAGLANALPDESIVLFRLARAGQREKAEKLYQWFLPLLRMDTVPKFVQLIKLVQERMGLGSSRVRAPRLALRGAELREALETIDRALERRPLSGN
jgi:4-hydroxy-tetrahydrodipicolinate synthase